jgi:hypothetical protein
LAPHPASGPSASLHDDGNARVYSHYSSQLGIIEVVYFEQDIHENCCKVRENTIDICLAYAYMRPMASKPLSKAFREYNVLAGNLKKMFWFYSFLFGQPVGLRGGRRFGFRF